MVDSDRSRKCFVVGAECAAGPTGPVWRYAATLAASARAALLGLRVSSQTMNLLRLAGVNRSGLVIVANIARAVRKGE